MSDYNTLKKLQDSGYLNPYGVWSVTTEGDCEGRTIRNLGAHEGYIDEIALKLADQCYYSLKFKKAPELPKTAKHTKVFVQLDSDSGTWDYHGEHLAEIVRPIFKDRPVYITEGQYYASFTINAGRDPEEAERERRKALLASALEKIDKYLTPEEREALTYSPKRSSK